MNLLHSLFGNRTFPVFGLYVQNDKGTQEYKSIQRNNNDIELSKTIYEIGRGLGYILPNNATHVVGVGMTSMGLIGRASANDQENQMLRSLTERVVLRGLAILFLEKEALFQLDCCFTVMRLSQEGIKRELESDTEYDFFPV